MSQLNERVLRFPRQHLRLPRLGEEVVTGHRRLIEAIDAGRRRRGRAPWREHKRSGQQVRMAVLSRDESTQEEEHDAENGVV